MRAWDGSATGGGGGWSGGAAATRRRPINKTQTESRSIMYTWTTFPWNPVPTPLPHAHPNQSNPKTKNKIHNQEAKDMIKTGL